jgi:hypothetical protein
MPKLNITLKNGSKIRVNTSVTTLKGANNKPLTKDKFKSRMETTAKAIAGLEYASHFVTYS